MWGPRRSARSGRFRCRWSSPNITMASSRRCSSALSTDSFPETARRRVRAPANSPDLLLMGVCGSNRFVAPPERKMEQVLANGVYLGAQYALIALGLTLIFSLMNVLNFAHGQMYVLGAFITYTVYGQLGLPFVVALA